MVYVNLTKLKLSGMELQWRTGCIRLACGYLWGIALITLIKVDRPTLRCLTPFLNSLSRDFQFYMSREIELNISKYAFVDLCCWMLSASSLGCALWFLCYNRLQWAKINPLSCKLFCQVLYESNRKERSIWNPKCSDLKK